MADAPRPWSVGAGGVRLTVRLTPRAGRDRIGEVAGVDGRPVLRVSVTAPPAEGAANAALRRLMGRALGVAKSAVTLASGETGRIKVLEIAGDGAAIAARLEDLAAPPG